MEENFQPDAASLQILRELQRDAPRRCSRSPTAWACPARRAGSASRPWRRAGVITGYSALVDRAKVGLGLLVVAEANLSQHSESLVRSSSAPLAATPEIVRCLALHHRPGRLHPDRDGAEHRRLRTLPALYFRLQGITHVLVHRAQGGEGRVRLPVPSRLPRKARFHESNRPPDRTRQAQATTQSIASVKPHPRLRLDLVQGRLHPRRAPSRVSRRSKAAVARCRPTSQAAGWYGNNDEKLHEKVPFTARRGAR